MFFELAHAAFSGIVLDDSGKGFVCRGNCSLKMQFDDAPARNFKAYLPETGEPAIFIADDKAFIAAMSKADTVTIEATLADQGKRSLRFEVGGYDAAKFPELPKAGK